MNRHHIYFVFSATPYKIGRFIRRFTGEAYNHVSIALDANLTEMYSFARRYFHTPLYGGFVKESLARHHVFGQRTDILVCALPVTKQQYDATAARLRDMYKEKERYLYNHFSALTVPFRKTVPVKDAYICVEFAAGILDSLGYLPKEAGYCTVGSLQQLLQPYAVYNGPVPEPEDADPEFFARHPVPYFTTLRFFGTLLSRLGK